MSFTVGQRVLFIEEKSLSVEPGGPKSVDVVVIQHIGKSSARFPISCRFSNGEDWSVHPSEIYSIEHNKLLSLILE